jgi:2-polyprenyl-3-methyl-5-hydroxy-6-metoxy-1,4-benzoquinol methylase
MGCGDGFVTNSLMESKFDVIGIDLSTGALTLNLKLTGE